MRVYRDMHRIRLAILPFLLSGCFGAEEFVRPAPPIESRWSAPAPSALERDARLTRWQEFFPDPRLQALIDTALTHNRDLHIAAARLEAARAEYGLAEAERWPALKATGSQNITGMSAELAGEGNDRISRRTDLSVGVVSFEIDLWNRLGSLSAAQRAQYLANAAAQRGVRLSLIGEVANTYFSLLDAEERLGLLRETVQLRQRTLDLIRLAQTTGFASDMETLTAEGTFEGAKSEVATLERQQAQARNKLALLVGRMPDELPPGNPLGDQEVVNNLAAGLPAEVLLARPDVVVAEERLKAAYASVDAARAAFLPKIMLTAALGLASGSLSRLLGAGNAAWNFQPSLTLPLLDGGRTQGQVDVNVARRTEAIAAYEKTLQEAFREVADLLAVRSSLLDQFHTVARQLNINDQRLQIVEARREAGVASMLNVLDARREWLATQQFSLQVRRAQLENAAQLYKALGGGELLAGVNAVAARAPAATADSLVRSAPPTVPGDT
ncbi:MAG: efflux transporter outer membrane subunit [Rhodocyclaceae bacterium]|nr:efflux transporter outer membrane subunit [Rhodocyclaceae bacterium]